MRCYTKDNYSTYLPAKLEKALLNGLVTDAQESLYRFLKCYDPAVLARRNIRRATACEPQSYYNLLREAKINPGAIDTEFCEEQDWSALFNRMRVIRNTWAHCHGNICVMSLERMSFDITDMMAGIDASKYLVHWASVHLELKRICGYVKKRRLEHHHPVGTKGESGHEDIALEMMYRLADLLGLSRGDVTYEA